jgi:ectoine utilization protein EutC
MLVIRSHAMAAEEFLILDEKELRACVALDAAALAAIESAFAQMARGEADVPAPMGIVVPEREGEVHIKSAYLRGHDGFAVKIASGFWRNAAEGLPVSSGMMLLLDARTAFPLALLLDNGYLTEVRTALAGAIAAKYLAPEVVRTVGVIGAGMQARMQVEALRLTRAFECVRVWARRAEAAQGYAQEISAKLGVEVRAAASSREVVRDSDLVITTTPARQPLVTAADMHPGLHITAMGSDGPGKQELDPQVLARADLVACDRRSQCERLGELQHAAAAGVDTSKMRIVELGQVIAGAQPGRTSEQQVTVCDLTGVGVQDTAIASLAYAKARARGLGRTFRSA